MAQLWFKANGKICFFPFFSFFFSIKSLTLQLSSNLTPLLSSQNKLMHFAGRVQLQAHTIKRRPSTFLPPTASMFFFFFSHLARWQLSRLNLELFTIRWNPVRPLLPFVFLIYKNKHQDGTSNCILSRCSLHKTCTGGQNATLFNGDSDLGGGATEPYTST